MGEGILIYGVNKRRYTRDLQAFAKKVLNRRKATNSQYRFGKLSKTVLRNLREQGIEPKTEEAVITDKTILKYRDHPKAAKGAVVDFRRFVMVEKAVKRPKNVYIDTNRNRLIYVAATKYSSEKVLKVVIEPNKKMGKKTFHNVVSIGVVDARNMNSKQYKKIK